MYKYLFETLLSVLLGIYPEAELPILLLLRSSAVLLFPGQLTREPLAEVEPPQISWRVWFSDFYQLAAVSAPTSHTPGLGFLLRKMEATAGGEASPPATRLQGFPEIMVLQQPGLCREVAHRWELDRPAVEVPLTPGTPSCLLSLQAALRAVSTLPHQAPSIPGQPS